MARLSAFLLFFFSCLSLYSQTDISGQWKAEVQGLQVYINVGDQLTLTIPAQGILDKKATNFEVSETRLDFYFQSFGATYIGEIKTDTIVGEWKQAGRVFTTNFVRNEDVLEIKRSQEPLQEITYVSEDVRFKSAGEDEYMLAGTITKPQGDGPFPAIVLVSGSGPQNRNSEIFNHKPFLIIADYFSRRGYMVLRYDDRGVGESKGYFAKVTTKDLAEDTDGAIKFLMERDDVDKNKLGILGHSEGGMIAPMVASENSDVDFIILAAAPGEDVKNLMIFQLTRQFEKIDGISEEGMASINKFYTDLINLVIKDVPNDALVDDMRQLTSGFYYGLSESDQKLVAPSEERFYFQVAPSMMSPYMRYFLRFQPEQYLTKVTIPTLALNGEKDVQVKCKENITAIKSAFKKSGQKKNLKVKTYKHMNHLFQTSETGEGSEYFTNEETFNEGVLEDILKWLSKI